MTAMNVVESRVDGVNGALLRAGAPFQVRPVSVPKPNLGELTGFATKAVPEDGLMHPIVYWQDGFNDLSDMDLAKQIIHTYIDGMKEEVPAFSEILKREYILEHVFPKVLERDSNLPMLEEHDVPFELLPSTDLLATFYVPVDGIDGTIQITKPIMDVAGLTIDELFDSAKTNVLKSMTVKSLSAVMCEMAGLPYESDMDEGGMPLYVVSNGTCLYGAGVMAGGVDAYRRIAEAIGADELFLLPSSLHEILAVPNHGQFTFQELLDMVTEINGAVVAPQDILSDNVYHFDARTAKLVHCR